MTNAKEADKMRKEQQEAMDRVTQEANQQRDTLQNQVSVTLQERSV